MVTFESTLNELAVKVDGRQIGWISSGRGFFTDSTIIERFIEISSGDLRKIALRSEIEQGFVTCSNCGCRAYPVDHKPTYTEYQCPNCLKSQSVFDVT